MLKHTFSKKVRNPAFIMYLQFLAPLGRRRCKNLQIAIEIARIKIMASAENVNKALS